MILLVSLSSSFHLFQFLSNFFKYSFSNFLLSHLNNNFAVYFPGNSLLLNSSALGFIFTLHLCSTPSCLPTSVFNLSSDSSTNSLAFSKSSFFFQVSCSAINLFYLTKYLSTPLIFLLFRIFSTSHSSTPSTTIGLISSFFCPSTCSLYYTIQLTFTTG